MSKLAKSIDATLTGNVKASRDLKLNYLDTSIAFNPMPLTKQIRFSVKLECDRFIEDSLIKNKNIYSEVLKDIKRAMIEEVFGEFRPMIIEMRSALYDDDKTRIRGLLAELEERMFNDGL